MIMVTALEQMREALSPDFANIIYACKTALIYIMCSCREGTSPRTELVSASDDYGWTRDTLVLVERMLVKPS